MTGIIVAAPDRVKFYALTCQSGIVLAMQQALDQDVRFGSDGDSHLSKIDRRMGESEKNLFSPFSVSPVIFFK